MRGACKRMRASQTNIERMSLSLVCSCVFIVSTQCRDRLRPEEQRPTSAESAALVASLTPAPSASETTPPASTSGRASAESELPRLLELTSELAKVHLDHAGDCAKLAASLAEFEAADGVLLGAIAKETFAAADANPDAKKQLHASMEAVMNVGFACRSAPEFRDFMRRRASK